MIVFKKIRWKNILSTGNTFTEISLDTSKSTLIVGENGAGKSTILDALCFALYGKPFRNINKNQLLNSINKKGLEVQVEFDVSKKKYKVIRGIKPNTFEIYCNDQLLDQTADQKEYQEMFERQILKLNHKSFGQIVVLGATSFVPFMQLTAANRREIIEDLLDIQIFSKMNVLLKEKISQNKTDIVDVSYGIKGIKEKIDIHKQHIDNIQQNIDELISAKQSKIKEVEVKVQEGDKKVGEFQLKVEKLEESITDSTSNDKKLNKLTTLESKLEDRLSKLKKEIEFFSNHDNCPTCKQHIDEDFKTTTVAEKDSHKQQIEQGMKDLSEQIKAIEDAIEETKKIEAQITKLKLQISEETSTLRIHKSTIANLKDEIKDLQGNTKQIDTNVGEVEKLEADLISSQQHLEELQNQKQTLDLAALMLKDSGIKTRIIKQYIPVMNKLINKYLAAMDFFVNFELNENFEETIKSRFRDEFSYESFSEGEKMRIDLALLFTWRAVAKLRNSTSTNILIMDEVFDSSLDGSGTEEFMKILNNLTQETNTFIISHKGDQLFDKFANVIRFEKHKNFSRIQQ